MNAQDCDINYYCPGGSRLATDTVCPVGHYCPAGTSFPIPCPLGTYNPDTQKGDVSDCLACEGFLATFTTNGDGGVTDSSGTTTYDTHNCNARGLEIPIEEEYFIPPGWYFDGASIVACEIGNFCNHPTNRAAMTPCASGFYAPHEYHGECWPCPEGFKCPDLKFPVPCDAGHYCGAQTRYVDIGVDGFATETGTYAGKCPFDTYMPHEGRRFLEECYECQEGFHCNLEGIDEVTIMKTDCPAGSYCPRGHEDNNLSNLGANYLDSTVNNDHEDEDAPIVCPAGSYCPQNSAFPKDCPVGTFSDATGQSTDATCSPAILYNYCALRGLTSAQCRNQGVAGGLLADDWDSINTSYTDAYTLYADPFGYGGVLEFYCGDGFMCGEKADGSQPLGAMHWMPTDPQNGGLCQPGKYCPANKLGPQDCPNGHYQPN